MKYNDEIVDEVEIDFFQGRHIGLESEKTTFHFEDVYDVRINGNSIDDRLSKYKSLYEQEKQRADKYEKMWQGFKNLMEVERATADEDGDNVDYDTFYYVVEKMKQYELENNQ